MMKRLRIFLTLALAIWGTAPAFADLLATDTFIRSNSTTVGGTSAGQAAWIDTYAGGQISSNALKGTLTSSNQANGTLSGSTIAGATTFNMTTAGGFIAGNFVAIGAGIATVEYRQIISVATNTVTVAALANAHSSSEVVEKIRNIPILRPVSEARTYIRPELKLPALGSTAFQSMCYLRWIDPGTWVSVIFIWNGSTTLTTQVQNANMSSTATVGFSLQNWTATTTQALTVQLACEGTSPTVVTVKVRDTATGLALAGPTNGTQTTSITAGTNGAIQTSGQQGLGFSDTVGSFTQFLTRDLTPLTVGVADTNFQAGLSPGNWRTQGTSYVTTNAVGSYGKWAFTGTTAVMTIDTSQWQAGAASVAVKWTVDNGAWTYGSITAGTTSISIASELTSAGAHTIRFYWRQNVGGGTLDLWNADVSYFHITGFLLDHGESFTTPPRLSKILAFFTDSLGTCPQAGETDSNPDPQLNHIAAFAAYLQAEYANLAYGGQAWNANSGNGNVPPIYTAGNSALTAYNKYDAAHTRTWPVAPDIIAVQLGTNDQLHVGVDAGITASVTGLIQALRTDFPSAKILIIEPFGKFKTAPILAGFTAANTSNCYWLPMPSWVSDGITNTGISWASGDGIHPGLGVESDFTAALIAAYITATTPASTGGKKGPDHV